MMCLALTIQVLFQSKTTHYQAIDFCHLLGCSISLANRILVDFWKYCCWWSGIELVDIDDDDIRERLGADGSTGDVGTIVESAPFVELDRCGYDRYEKTNYSLKK